MHGCVELYVDGIMICHTHLLHGFLGGAELKILVERLHLCQGSDFFSSCVYCVGLLYFLQGPRE
eukprot:jgi/Mesvir1/19747/Mv25375-RA.1